MDPSSGAALAPAEPDPRLQWLVGQEIDLLRFKKDLYDADHPEHTKELSDSELGGIAQTIITQKLSVPPESYGEAE